MLTPGALSVTPPMKWTAYCYCLLIATVLSSTAHPLIGDTGVNLLGPAVFLAVNYVWARRLASALTDPAAWTRRLRNADQAYNGTPGAPTLDSGLGRLRSQVVVRELMLSSVMVAGAVLSGAVGTLFGGPVVHLGLLATTLGVIGTELTLAAARSLSTLTASVPVRLSPMERENALSESMLADIQDSVRRVARKISIFVVIFLALRSIADLLDVWELLRVIYTWITGVL